MPRLVPVAFCACLIGIGTLIHDDDVATASSRGTASVVGGAPSTPGTYPWMAALVVRPPYSLNDLFFPGFDRAPSSASATQDDFFCGGTLIGPDRVLTAGHCATGLSPREIDVLIGDGDLGHSPLLRVHVKAIATHPDFNQRDFLSPPRNDVAILKLARPVDVPPLPLIDPARAAQLPAGSIVRALGRGATNPDGDFIKTSSMVREVDLPLVADASCKAMFPRKFRQASQLCAGATPGRGVCFGDSGGPLLVASDTGWLELGVASSLLRVGDCAGRDPEVFSRLATLGQFALSPAPTYAPYNLRRPAIHGRLRFRAKLRCTPGRWHGQHNRFRYTWLWRKTTRLGPHSTETRPVRAHGRRLRVTRNIIRDGVECLVEAANPGGISIAGAHRSGRHARDHQG